MPPLPSKVFNFYAEEKETFVNGVLSSFAEKDGPAPHPSFSLNEPKIWTIALSDLKWPESHCSLQKAPETQGLLWSRITSLKKAGVLVRGSNKGLVRTLAPVPCGPDCYHLSSKHMKVRLASQRGYQLLG